MTHNSGILLEMATNCDNTTDHMKDQVTELAKVKLEYHHIKYHLYKVISVLCVLIKLSHCIMCDEKNLFDIV